MMKQLLGGVALALLVVGALRCAPDVVEPVDYVKLVEKTPWEWADEKSLLKFSIDKHLKDYTVETTEPAPGSGLTVNVKTEDGKEVCSFAAHTGTVLARSGDTLFVTDFGPASTGCSLQAIDLKTGKQRWKTRVKGLGPISHTKYRNRIIMDADGKAIVIRGNESAGRYIEFIDVKTGKMLANRVYKD